MCALWREAIGGFANARGSHLELPRVRPVRCGQQFPRLGGVPHQGADGGAPGEEALDHALADAAGGAGDEHRVVGRAGDGRPWGDGRGWAQERGAGSLQVCGVLTVNGKPGRAFGGNSQTRSVGRDSQQRTVKALDRRHLALGCRR